MLVSLRDDLTAREGGAKRGRRRVQARGSRLGVGTDGRRCHSNAGRTRLVRLREGQEGGARHRRARREGARAHLLGLGGVECLLAVAEAVDRLVIGGLVPAEPLADARDGARVVGLDVVDVVDLVGELVVGVEGDDLGGARVGWPSEARAWLARGSRHGRSA